MNCINKIPERNDCEINFISSWSDLSSDTWSGTPYNLLKEISQKAKVNQFTATTVTPNNTVMAKVNKLLDVLSFGFLKLRKDENPSEKTIKEAIECATGYITENR